MRTDTNPEGAKALNELIISPRAVELRIVGFGKPEQGVSPLPVATDSQGRMILSPGLDPQVQSNALDIRPLAENRDSVTCTVSELSVRGLTGERDSLSISRKESATATQTDQILIGGTVYFLPTDIGAYRQTSFYVSNVGLSVGVNVALEIAPQNTDSYYVTDVSSGVLLGGQTVLLSPTRLMRYARIRVSAILTLIVATVTVHFFGRV